MHKVIITNDNTATFVRIQFNFMQDVAPGDRLDIEFTLDDRERSLIKKEVVVRSVNGKSVGAEFTSTEHYERLGPYLLFDMDQSANGH